MDNVSVINLKSLRWSLAVLLLALLLAAAAGGGAQYFRQQAEAGHKQAQAAQADTRARLARANDDEREIRERIVRYQELIDQGRSQPERRLEWVETLNRIKAERRLLGLDYEITPQRPLDEKAVVSGGFSFLTSPMKLEMPLLHENDLLGLLADLQAQVQAIISPRRCLIERVAAPPTQSPAAFLKASCEIDWITLQEKT
ncbi:MAG: hypothetical protein AB1642_09725 [Pseudomonadota bacterium]